MTAESAAPERDGAAAYWGARAEEYDEFIVRVVPRYAEMHDRLIDYAPADASRVLELGTGTGSLSVRLVERWPDATFTFVDGAREMLDITRGRLHALAPAAATRMQFTTARFEELQLERGAYDVAIASLSLHHVEGVAAVYDRLAPALAAGGRLVMLDGVRGETDAEHSVHMARWHEHWLQPGGLSDDEVREVSDHVASHDHYRTLTDHFNLLHHAGFASVDCVWRDGLFALITATVS